MALGGYGWCVAWRDCIGEEMIEKIDYKDMDIPWATQSLLERLRYMCNKQELAIRELAYMLMIGDRRDNFVEHYTDIGTKED